MAHPHEDSDKSADFLELFFDLIFVYAITQLAAFIHHHPDTAGFLRAGALFAIIWWGWSQFTWTCNGIDARDPRARLAVLLATVFAFFMAQGLPDAFTDEAEWFSVPFGITLAIGLLLYWWGLRNEAEHQRALVTYLPIAMLAAVLAGATGFFPGDLHEWGYGTTIALFIVAGLAAGVGTPFHVYARHFAERHALILIVALGESIIAVGVGSSGLNRSPEFALAVGAAIAAICVFWWSYFAWFQGALEQALHEAAPHGRSDLARDTYTFAHAPIVLGIVGIAVAAEAVIAHPGDELPNYALFGLAAGNALFLLGMVAAFGRAAGAWLTERAVAVVLIVIAVFALQEVSALSLGALVVGIHVAALAAEFVRRPQLAR